MGAEVSTRGTYPRLLQEATTAWGPGEPRLNRLVFIGRGLRQEELRESFAKLVRQPAQQRRPSN